MQLSPQDEFLFQKLEDCKISVMNLQYHAAQLVVLRKPPDVPQYYYNMIMEFLKTYESFCSGQRVLLNIIQDRVVKGKL